MTSFFYRRVLLASSLLFCSVAGAVRVGTDVAAIMRAQAEAARRLTVPPPPQGVIDVQWNQLSPPGWNPGKILDRLGVSELKDDDPKAKAILAEVQHDWQRAPAISSVPLTPIRLTGFPVMLDDKTGAVKKILLVPYYGACIHMPPPPANQVVVVTLDRELSRSMYQYPVSITGNIAIKPSTTQYGRAIYQITNAKWEAYQYLKYPLPQYRLPQ